VKKGPRIARALGPTLALGAVGLFVAASLTVSPPAGANDPALARARQITAQRARARMLLDGVGRRPGAPHPLAGADGRVPVLALLPEGTAAASLGMREVAPGVGAVRVSPSDVEDLFAASEGLPLFVSPPLRPLLDRSDTSTGVAAFREATGAAGAGVVVGVIDTSFDLRHPDLRTADGYTRVEWLLRSGPPLGLEPELEAAYGCDDPSQAPCQVLSKADIDALLVEGSDSELLSDPTGHGTHVASIAAGNGGVWLDPAPRFVGMAPEASLVLAAVGLEGSFRDDELLRSASFVFERAENALVMPAVVNLSVGGDFGAHDGSSALERGLAALVGESYPGRSIVVASGNSGGLFVTEHDPGAFYGIHTEIEVAGYGDVEVPIFSFPAEDGQGYVFVTFDAGDELEVGLRGPSGTWIEPVGPGSNVRRDVDDEGTSVGVIHDAFATSSLIGAGSSARGAMIVWDGRWGEGDFAVTLRGRGYAKLWLAGGGEARDALFFRKGRRLGTVSIPATEPSLLSVGCTLNRRQWTDAEGFVIELSSFGAVLEPEPDELCYFSGVGPNALGVPKPELVAPGAYVAAAMSELADPRAYPGSAFDLGGCPDEGSCYVVDDTHGLLVGTSMASPHVAGAVALLLERAPDLTQGRVRELLMAGARYPRVPPSVEQQLGVGVLDVEGAGQVLELEGSQVVPPAAGASWWGISVDVLRPDVVAQGFVSLRGSSAAIPQGFDESKLTLTLDRGRVVTPPTRVAAGLFTFAIAASARDLGHQITVDARWDGTSLGARKLRVLGDPFQLDEAPVAVGGCAVARALAPDPRPPGRAAMLALGLALAVYSRAGRRRVVGREER
jgi:subtilisin family serine protease